MNKVSPPAFLGSAIRWLMTINLALLAIFFSVRWHTRSSMRSVSRLEVAVVAGYAGLLLLSYVASRVLKRLQEPTLLWNFSHLAIVFCLLLLDAVGVLCPQWLPRALIYRNPALAPRAPRQHPILEHLSENPWIKFVPNTRIEFVTNRKDVKGSWDTDRLGFKNLPGLADRTVVDAVAVGDSFVEALGVPIDETWESLLKAKGLSVYNLGVQGYAPRQALGALKQWGHRFKPRVIFWGYTPGYESRELFYNRLVAFDQNQWTQGGIGGIGRYMQEQRLERRFLPVTNTLIDTLFATAKFLIRRTTSRPPLPTGPIERVRSEVDHGAEIAFNPKAPELLLTEAALLQAHKIGEQWGADVLVVFFTQRASAYYERLRGAPPPHDHFERATAACIKALCARHHIGFLDLYPPTARYLAQLPPEGELSIDDLPYFEVDPHMSPAGQKIIATEVARWWQTHLSPHR